MNNTVVKSLFSMKTLVDKVHTVVEQVSHVTQIRKKKKTNETIRLIQDAYNIYTSKAEKQNKTEKKHIFEVINPRSHNAYQKCTRRSTYFCIYLVSGFNSNFSFTLNFSFQKNVMKTLSLGVSDLLLARWI